MMHDKALQAGLENLGGSSVGDKNRKDVVQCSRRLVQTEVHSPGIPRHKNLAKCLSRRSTVAMLAQAARVSAARVSAARPSAGLVS
eukprot:15472651-Alexandrium_andersonii.AAC.1